MPVVDDFGVWEGLGSVQPAFDWQLFPLFAKTPNSTFRISYSGNFESTLYPPSFIRAVYFSGSQYFFDRNWIKIYPKDEPEIIQIPYPSDMIVDPLPQRQIQIKLSGRARRYNWSAMYSVELFEKQTSNVTYPVSTSVATSEFYE